MNLFQNSLIVIPAYNEENNITAIINEIKSINKQFQILVADDGSKDRTKEISLELGVKVISNKVNLGKGSILKKALYSIIASESYSNFKWVFTLDGDGQHLPSEIIRFFSYIKKYPKKSVFIGKRDFSLMPIANFLSNISTSKWCDYWLKWQISDLQCGYRCYSLDLLRQVLSLNPKSSHFDFETEILLLGWLKDYHYLNIPIKTIYTQNRVSRIHTYVDTFRWMSLIFQFGIRKDVIQKIVQLRKK